MLKLSVIICTHNPREDYLRRVLEALDRQTLGKDQWELLLIDNASAEPLSGKYDLSWHPNARHVREETLGLTPARLRGISEAAAEILVFVDDDNVLANNYLALAIEISTQKPFLGAFNGSIKGIFEIEPPGWIQQYLHLMAVGKVHGDRWGYGPGLTARVFAPCGAGLVIKSDVARFYSKSVQPSAQRKALGRSGGNLVSAEDIDMVLCACRLGYSIGRLEKMNLDHLIPARRLTKGYLLALVEGIAYSDEWIYFIWTGATTYHRSLPGKIERILELYHYWKSKLSLSADIFEKIQFHKSVRRAEIRGILRAQCEIKMEPTVNPAKPKAKICKTNLA